MLLLYNFYFYSFALSTERTWFHYISLLIIPCIIYYVTNKETLNLELSNFGHASRFHLVQDALWSYSAFPPPLSLAPLLCRSSVHAGPEWFFPARWLHERLAFLLSHRLSEWVTVNQCAQRLDVAAERSWLLQYSWTAKGACRYKRRFVSGFLVMMIGTLLN